MISINDMATSKNQVHTDLSTKELVEIALARGEGVLASNQALTVHTGARTGRSPKDRFIVKDPITEHTVDWNNINQPFSPEKFDALWQKATRYLDSKDSRFTSYLQVGAHAKLGIPVEVITELAWHNLFAHVLFIRPEKPAVTHAPNQWTILSVPGFQTDPAQDG